MRWNVVRGIICISDPAVKRSSSFNMLRFVAIAAVAATCALADNPTYKPAPYTAAPLAYKPTPTPYKPAPTPYKPAPTPYQPAPTPYKPAPVAYKPAPYHEPKYDEVPKPYAFQYGVHDDYSGANFNAQETADGKAVSGSYQVHVPDGRVQTVTYTADHYNGYVADVKYEGQPVYPKYEPKPAYKPVHKPAPAYHA